MDDKNNYALLNYSYIRYATAILLLAGIAGHYFFLAKIKVAPEYFGWLYLGLVLPAVFFGGIFLYKTRIGIKKGWVGLSFWALWMSYAVGPSNFLIWTIARAAYPVYGGLLLAGQIINLMIASQKPIGMSRVLIFPIITAVLCFLTQIATLLVYFPVKN
jgi:hypothetical protein